MAYPIDRWYEKLVADDRKGDEQVDWDEGVQHDGPVLPLMLREEARWEIVDGRRRAVPQQIYEQQQYTPLLYIKCTKY